MALHHSNRNPETPGNYFSGISTAEIAVRNIPSVPYTHLSLDISPTRLPQVWFLIAPTPLYRDSVLIWTSWLGSSFPNVDWNCQSPFTTISRVQLTLYPHKLLLCLEGQSWDCYVNQMSPYLSRDNSAVATSAKPFPIFSTKGIQHFSIQSALTLIYKLTGGWRWAGEIAQRGTCLPCMHDDPSSDAQHPWKR